MTTEGTEYLSLTCALLSPNHVLCSAMGLYFLHFTLIANVVVEALLVIFDVSSL